VLGGVWAFFERSAWSACRPVALWHFPKLCYCVVHDSRALGDHWVSSLDGAMHVPFHMLVVLLYSAHRAFSCNLHFLGPQALSSIFSQKGSLIHYYTQ